MLRLILAGHSRLHIPPETWFIRSLVCELPLTSELTPAQIDRAVTIITEHDRWSDMGIAAGDLRRWVADDLQSPMLVDIINLVYREQLARTGKSRFGDKTPNYCEIVPELTVLYPGAKFIQVIRDGRDVAISYIDLDWERYYECDRFQWTCAMAKRREYLISPYARQILEVRYEDLVSDLEGTVRRICAFLGESFEPAMLNWHKLTTLVPARERHIHRKLDRPVLPYHIALWRQRLSTLECFAIEACLHRDLEQLGYRLRFGSIALRPLLSVSGWLLCAAAPMLRRGIPYLQRRKILPRTLYI